MSSLFQKYNVPGPRYTSYPQYLIGKIAPIPMKNGSLRYGLPLRKAITPKASAFIYTYLFVRVFVPFVAAISISPKGTKWKTLI